MFSFIDWLINADTPLAFIIGVILYQYLWKNKKQNNGSI